MYRKIQCKIQCDVRQWKILGIFHGTKHSRFQISETSSWKKNEQIWGPQHLCLKLYKESHEQIEWLVQIIESCHYHKSVYDILVHFNSNGGLK